MRNVDSFWYRIFVFFWKQRLFNLTLFIFNLLWFFVGYILWMYTRWRGLKCPLASLRFILCVCTDVFTYISVLKFTLDFFGLFFPLSSIFFRVSSDFYNHLTFVDNYLPIFFHNFLQFVVKFHRNNLFFFFHPFTNTQLRVYLCTEHKVFINRQNYLHNIHKQLLFQQKKK